MRYTTKFGTFFGIPVRIHFTFPLILVAFGIEAYVRGGFFEALQAIGLILSVFVCVVLHEFGHSLQVRRYGIEVRDIVLLPIGGMARAERIPENPRQEIIVAISGPLVNFVLATLLFGLAWLLGDSASVLASFVVNLLFINILLGVFNLVPAFPMDGGRILRGILATRMSYARATRYAKNVGQVIAILFVIIGFMRSEFIMLPIIAVFIYFGAISEERMVKVKVAFEGKSARDFLRGDIEVLSTADTVQSVVPIVNERTPFALPVTDAYRTLAGAVATQDLLAAAGEGRGDDTLAGLVKTGFPLIEGDTPAAQIYYLFKTQKLPLAGIMHHDRYLGLLFFDDLAAALG